jgi:hypothetical protein
MDSDQTDAGEFLQLDIDVRLGPDFWVTWWSSEDEPEILAALARSAYGSGYVDALTETSRGQLCRDHGYPVPSRGRPASKKSRPE